MTTTVNKNPRKSEFIRILKSQKDYFKHYFREEEKLNIIFERFAEIIFNLENRVQFSKQERIINKIRINDQITDIKEKTIKAIMMHKGSLL